MARKVARSRSAQPKRAARAKMPMVRTKQGVVRILNCNPSRDQQQDWKFEHAAAAGLVTAAFPKSRDLRENWWAIGDQGSTGSCVGWATADGVLRWHFVKKGRVAPTDHLSERFIWMAAKETDEFTHAATTFIESEGTSLKAALDIARKFGCVRDEVLPFETGLLYAGEVQTFYATAAQLKITSYTNLGVDLTKWRQWLGTNGPILTRVDVDATWDNAKATNGKLATYKPATRRGGHAVTLVGYDSKMFIVRNSWGTTLWGDRGFAYASNAYAAAAFTEAYGVTVA